jgi:hypothetical protein
LLFFPPNSSRPPRKIAVKNGQTQTLIDARLAKRQNDAKSGRDARPKIAVKNGQTQTFVAVRLANQLQILATVSVNQTSAATAKTTLPGSSFQCSANQAATSCNRPPTRDLRFIFGASLVVAFAAFVYGLATILFRILLSAADLYAASFRDDFDPAANKRRDDLLASVETIKTNGAPATPDANDAQ